MTRLALAISLAVALPSCGDVADSTIGQTTPGGAGGSAGSATGAAGSGGGIAQAGSGGSAGAQAGAANAFPLGTWTTCVEGIHTQIAVFLNGAGFQQNATLTLSPGASGPLATYVDQNGVVLQLAFHDTGADTALLASPLLIKPESTAMCVTGPGITASYPATMAVSNGTMTYDHGVVLVELGGIVSADTGCGSVSSPGNAWFLCEDGPAPSSAAGTSPAAFPVGGYTCTSEAATYYEAQGLKQFLTAGGENGKLTLSQSGATLTAEYASDKFVTGTMHLTATTATTAIAEAGQSLSAACYVPAGTGSVTPETLPLSFGALLVDGPTLLLAFAGTMPTSSACGGAKKAGTLVCVKTP